VVVEDVDQHAGDTPPTVADPSLAAEDDGVGVGEAVDLPMQRDAEAEFGVLDQIGSALEEIAEQIAERDEA